MHINSFNETISTTDEETDLGVLFTTDLKSSRYINNIILKANRTLALIRRAFQSLNAHLFKILYVSLVQPQLDYLSSVWNPYHLKDIGALENVQRCATRLIPSFIHSYVLPQSLNIFQFTFTFNLYCRRRMDIVHMILTFNIALMASLR